MDISQLKKMKRTRRSYRLIGAMFTLVSCLLLLMFVPLLFDPDAIIIYNGVPTSDYGVKLGATLFVGGFTILGLALLLCPSKYLNNLFLWTQSFKAAIFGGRK